MGLYGKLGMEIPKMGKKILIFFAPPRFVICADGAGIGRFPPAREWGILFLLSAPFSILACPFAFPRHSSHSCFRPFPPYSHSREGGNLPVAEAGRATLAPLRFVICADGAGIGRFPPAREWRVCLIVCCPHPISIPPTPTIPPLFPFPRRRESPCG